MRSAQDYAGCDFLRAGAAGFLHSGAQVGDENLQFEGEKQRVHNMHNMHNVHCSASKNHNQCYSTARMYIIRALCTVIGVLFNPKDQGSSRAHLQTLPKGLPSIAPPSCRKLHADFNKEKTA